MTLRGHRSGRWLLAVAALVLLSIGLGTSAAAAQTNDTGTRTDGGWFTVNGPVVVAPDDVVNGSVVVISGNVTVRGTVEGDVFLASGNVLVAETGRVTGAVTVFSGNATIAGTIGDAVTVFSGTATLAPTASVNGDVRSSTRPIVAPGAAVAGTVGGTDAGAFFALAGVGLVFGWWVVVSVSTLLLGLLFVGLFFRAADSARLAATRRFGPSVLAALVLAIALPVAAFFAMGTLVALPLGLAVLASLLLLYPLGYVVAAHALGGTMVRGHPLGAFLAGWAILRAVALVPVIGALGWILASAFGVGALFLAVWAARTPTPLPTSTSSALGPRQPLPPPTVGLSH